MTRQQLIDAYYEAVDDFWFSGKRADFDRAERILQLLSKTKGG